MKTYEEFLVFLDDHLKSMSDFIPVTDKDFHAICTATARFLLSEPFRWEKLLPDWPKEPEVPKPGEKEMLEFFKTNKGMPLSFRKELMANDLDTLYKAYYLFFAILVLKDEFLVSVFRDDVRARRYKKVFKQSERKLTRIEDFINEMKSNENFLSLMRKFTKDLEGFSLTLINNKNLLDQAIKKIEER
ncbi:MAG: hypothetical protein GY950_33140 [bacterium]|nr:hypothetical protein [bacterium]